MPKTGSFFIDSFMLMYTLFPLLPVIVIFLRRIYHKDSLNFLMILCLLNFIGGLLLFIPGLIAINQIAISHIFMMLELAIMVQLFRTVFPQKIKYILGISLVALLSSLITYYLLTGITQRKPVAEDFQYAVIIFVAVLGLVGLIRKNDLHIFQLPLFWIAIGTIFYFSITVLVNAIYEASAGVDHVADTDRLTIVAVAGIIRYVFYFFAAVCYIKPEQENTNAA